MKQNIDKEQYRNYTPFTVPENYFFKLKNDIQFRTESKNLKFNQKHYLRIKSTSLIVSSLVLFFFLWNYIYNLKVDNNLSSDQLYDEFVDYEIQGLDEEFFIDFLHEEEYVFSDEIEYLINNNIDYSLIIE